MEIIWGNAFTKLSFFWRVFLVPFVPEPALSLPKRGNLVRLALCVSHEQGNVKNRPDSSEKHEAREEERKPDL
jgi:hypothetical protein